MAFLSLSVLGPFQATLDGEPVTSLKANKVRALLVYLAVEAHVHPGAHPRQTLAGLLWPGKPERTALANLRNALAILRTAIGDRDATPPFLQITREAIQFNRASDHWLDLAAFQALVQTSAEASSAEGTTSEEASAADQPIDRRLQEAVALYRGDLLAGFSVRDSPEFEEWVLLLREKLHWQALQALEALAAYHEERRAYGEAIASARRQVALEPWQESAHRQLMHCLALSGQRGAALAQYAICCQVLADELGVEPERATTALYQRIRQGTLTAPPVAPAQGPQAGVEPADAQAAARTLSAEDTVAPPALPVDALLDSEQRTVTVIQAEIRGSAALLARVRSEDGAAIKNQLLHALGVEAARFEGEVERHGETGLVACFGATTAHEDDPERGVLAALAMQERFSTRLQEWVEQGEPSGLAEGLELLVAVHTGQAVIAATEEGGPGQSAEMGEALAFLARAQTAAKPGEVWVSEATRRLVEPLFEWAPRGEIGTSGQVERVSCALGRRAHLDKMRGIAGLSSPLIGRDAELCALQDAVERLRDGVGGVVTLVGEAGIGKSRLVAEIRADQGSDTQYGIQHTAIETGNTQWVEGRCLSYATEAAYSLWVDVLRGLLKLDGDASPETMAEALCGRVDALCRAQAGEVYPFVARMLSLPLTGSAADRLQGVEGEGLQVLTFRAVEMLVERAAQREPLALVCEDLHWADPTSLALLEHLLPLTDRAPLLVICVLRPETGHGCWRIKETVDRLYGHRHTGLWLNSLTERESTELVDHLLRPLRELREDLPRALRDRILGHAEGNPFYVEEILRSLMDDAAGSGGAAGGKVIELDETTRRWTATRDVADLLIPDTLRGVLLARIDRLPRGARQVLQLASVVGRRFTYPVLSAVACPPPRHRDGVPLSRVQEGEAVLDAHLVALQRAQMVRETSRVPEATYAFKHQLTLEAAYDSLPRRKRRVLHRRVAEALEQFFPERGSPGPGGGQPGLLAHHWERAGAVERAIPYLRRAGERAAAQFANEEAISYFSRALDLLPEESLERYALLLARRRAYARQGDKEAEARDLASLAGLAELLGDKTKQAEVAVRQARFCTETGKHEQAISTAQAAVRLAQDVQDAGIEAMAHREWGRVLSVQGMHKAARPHLERALDLAQGAGLRRIEADALHALGTVLYNLDDAESGMACYERALRICRQIGDRRREGEALRYVGWTLLIRVNWTESEVYLRESLNVSRETGNRREEAWAVLSLGLMSYFQGHYARSWDEHEQSLRIFREIRDWRHVIEALWGLGYLSIALVDYASARDYFEQCLRIYGERNSHLQEGWTLFALGLVFHLQGDDVSAETHYKQARLVGRKTNDWTIEAQAWMYEGLLSHHRGDDRAAQAYCQQALRLMPNLELGWAVDLIHVFAILGHALAGLGRLAEAAENYRQGLAMRRERGQHHLTVEPLAGLARVALAQGDLVEALAHVGEILDYMGDHPALHGTLEPLRIYLTCYRVLVTNKDPRAGEILDAAYRLLQERAGAIEDEGLRRSYLENVAAHRGIVALGEGTSHP
jgi:DNA-binding SARP family transcriptional activator/tetratricopeptide (TPR) repeat protein/class 3 adenylate cyclase